MRKITQDSAGGVMLTDERVVDLDFADYDVAFLGETW